MVRRKQRTFTVRIEPAGTPGWWTAQVVEEPGAITQGRSLSQTKERIREALSLILDDDSVEDPKQVELVLDVRPQVIARKLKRTKILRAKADRANAELAKLTNESIAELAKLGLSTRDAGELLGISHQRVAAKRARAS